MVKSPIGAGDRVGGEGVVDIIDIGDWSSVPPVLRIASVSVSVSLALLETLAASLVPLMVICTVLGVPSTLVTLKVSLMLCVSSS